MSESQIKFVEDFSTPTYDEWVGEVEKALKGAPFEKKMYTKTYEGVTVRPVYTRQDWPPSGDPSGFPGASPYTRESTAAGNRIHNWDVRQVHGYPDPEKCNDIILRDLERGVTSLVLRFDSAARNGLDGDAADAQGLAGDDGIMVYSVDDLDLLLTGVHLDLAPVALSAGAQFLPAAGLLAGLWSKRGISADKAWGAFQRRSTRCPGGHRQLAGSCRYGADADGRLGETHGGHLSQCHFGQCGHLAVSRGRSLRNTGPGRFHGDGGGPI